MPRKYAILVAVSLAVVFLDQWTKYVAVRELTSQLDGQDTLSGRLAAFYGNPPPEGAGGLHFRPVRSVTVVESFLRFRYAENKGAAWGMFRNLPEQVRVPFFHVIILGAVVLIIAYYRKLDASDPAQRWALWGLPLVLGGAVGNYIDRLSRGFVVDYIQAHWFDRAYFPSFNVADSAITVGVGLLLLDGFLRRESRAHVSSP
ncbi:MAG: signal peptidase II [Myxococcaceae bacterium]|nr:signal peptidase II [Myxococcaceae bacterium]MCI0671304.1 signal peptidase II [Myxococcaceae bacterium]